MWRADLWALGHLVRPQRDVPPWGLPTPRTPHPQGLPDSPPPPQSCIDWNREVLKRELGLAERDIVDIPQLFKMERRKAVAFFPDLVRPSAGASDFVRSGAKPSLPRGPAPAASVFGVEGPGLGARRLRGPTVPAEGPLLDRLSVTTRCSLAKPALRGHLGRPFSPPGDPLGICAVSERLHEAMRGAPTGRSDSPFSQLPDTHPPATYPV